MKNVASHTWLPIHDDHLKTRYDDGDSFSEIAASMLENFDVVVSRNACIGRAHRLGLKASSKSGEGRKVQRNKTRSSRAANSKGGALAAKVNRSDTVVRPSAFQCREAGDAEPLHVDVLELTAGMCRWPYGDVAPYTFCGQTASGAYCTAHSRIAYGRHPIQITPEEQERRRQHGAWLSRLAAKKRAAA
jgi:hypothetical protein